MRVYFMDFIFCGIMFYLICNGCDYIINLIMLYVVWYFFKIGSVKIIQFKIDQCIDVLVLDLWFVIKF